MDNPMDAYKQMRLKDTQQMIERRRQALLCDLFITGSNAITKDAKLVNLVLINRALGL